MLNELLREWEGEITMSCGDNSSRGILILFRPQLDCNITDVSRDDHGRIITCNKLPDATTGEHLRPKLRWHVTGAITVDGKLPCNLYKKKKTFYPAKLNKNFRLNAHFKECTAHLNNKLIMPECRDRIRGDIFPTLRFKDEKDTHCN